MAIDYSKSLSTLANTSLGMAPPTGSRPRRVDVNQYKNLNSIDSGQYSVPQSSVPTNLGSVTTPYGGSTRYEKFHPAIDIANKMGTPIPAFKGGKVVEVSTGKKQGDKGYGNYIIIKDEGGNKWRYSHLKDEYVQMGQYVKQGDIISTMGNSGSTYSAHGRTDPAAGTHLDIRILNSYAKYVDPTKYVSSYLTQK